MVSIIIINYNTFELTRACIASVIAHTKQVDYEIILVDNASDECDPDLFFTAFPNIKLVKSKYNLGFAGGNNLGIKAAKGDVMLLLNSDTLLQEDAVSLAYKKLQNLPQVAALGVRMVYPGGTIQHTARRFRSISWELLDLFRFIPMLMPYQLRAKTMLGKYFKADFDTTCDWLNGAFLMLRKNVIQQMKGAKFDERFFMYGEDHLWGVQIHQLGYQNYFFAGTTIVHINSGSTRPEKQLQLIPVMFRHELAIMRLRKGAGIYYYGFLLLYGAKEWSRYIIKRIYFSFTGKKLR